MPYLTSEENLTLDVASVLRFSFDRLMDEDPALAQHWQILSMFPGDFDAEAVSAVWNSETEQTRDDLNRLHARSLLQYDVANERWRLHDLYRELAAEGLDDEIVDHTRKQHASHYCDVLSRINRRYCKGSLHIYSALKAFDLDSINIEFAIGYLFEYCQSKQFLITLMYQYLRAGVQIIELRLFPERRIQYYQCALLASRRLDDLKGECIANGNLGIAYGELKRYRQAIACFDEQLRLARQSGNRADEGSALVH